MKVAIVYAIMTASMVFAAPAQGGIELLGGPYGDPIETVIAPDGRQCYWANVVPFCGRGCQEGFTETAWSKCGDGACCWTGDKSFCCK